MIDSDGIENLVRLTGFKWLQPEGKWICYFASGHEFLATTDILINILGMEE